MASGTVARIIETKADPKQEIVVFDNINSGDTYVSRKFVNVKSATISSNSSDSGTMTVSFSGATATVYTEQSSVDCTLVLHGDE